MFPQLSFQRHPATLLVMATIVALEALCTLGDLQGVDTRMQYYFNWFADRPGDLYFGLGIEPHVWDGQLWRPFTTTLMHGSAFHALFNVYWLARFGPAIEEWAGSFKTMGLFIVLGMLSSMPEYVVTNFGQGPKEQIPIVGFSGVNYGLFGLVLIGRRYRTEFAWVCDDNTARFLLGWFFICFPLTYLNILPVANVAHGAGFIFGALIGLTIFHRQHRWQWAAALAVVSLLVIVTMFYCPGHRGYEWMRGQQALFGQADATGAMLSRGAGEHASL